MWRFLQINVLLGKILIAAIAVWYAYQHGKWHWWIFGIALIPCGIVAQFRAGRAAELRGQTGYALDHPGQVILWSIIFGAIYAAVITAALGFFF